MTVEAAIIIATDTRIVTKSIDSQSLTSVVINDTDTTGQFLVHIYVKKGSYTRI